MKIFNQVQIPVYIKDELDSDGSYTLGYWEYPDNRVVWGLLLDGFPTHMCYGISYATPKEAYKKVVGFGKFYFDAGGNGRPVYVEAEDLKQGFKDLGIWDYESHVCNERCICVIHLTPLWYHKSSDEHACQNPDCDFAKGFYLVDITKEALE